LPELSQPQLIAMHITLAIATPAATAIAWPAFFSHA